nr:MAG TPA: hypothetical protein [Caudoviricetes sp.]
MIFVSYSSFYSYIFFISTYFSYINPFYFLVIFLLLSYNLITVLYKKERLLLC